MLSQVNTIQWSTSTISHLSRVSWTQPVASGVLSQCTLHTAISNMITILDQWGLMWIPMTNNMWDTAHSNQHKSSWPHDLWGQWKHGVVHHTHEWHNCAVLVLCLCCACAVLAFITSDTWAHRCHVALCRSGHLWPKCLISGGTFVYTSLPV